MPIYEYVCENGHSFEVRQGINDPPLQKCRICSGKAQRKIFATPQLKDAGLHFFTKEHGDRDILHDPQFSDRERKEFIARAQAEAIQQSVSASFPGAKVITPYNQPKGKIVKRKREI
jgi:putative FmdB family regulatory protein